MWAQLPWLEVVAWAAGVAATAEVEVDVDELVDDELVDDELVDESEVAAAPSSEDAVVEVVAVAALEAVAAVEVEVVTWVAAR